MIFSGDSSFTGSDGRKSSVASGPNRQVFFTATRWRSLLSPPLQEQKTFEIFNGTELPSVGADKQMRERRWDPAGYGVREGLEACSLVQAFSWAAFILFGDFRNPSKHGFRNTYLIVSLVRFMNSPFLFVRFLILVYLSDFVGYQYFRLCKCPFDNPNLLHFSWF
ncbi:hypothetical protein LXL04_008238 [Taraxacum kok-saghyz]